MRRGGRGVARLTIPGRWNTKLNHHGSPILLCPDMLDFCVCVQLFVCYRYVAGQWSRVLGWPKAAFFVSGRKYVSRRCTCLTNLFRNVCVSRKCVLQRFLLVCVCGSWTISTMWFSGNALRNAVFHCCCVLSVWFSCFMVWFRLFAIAVAIRFCCALVVSFVCQFHSELCCDYSLLLS